MKTSRQHNDTEVTELEGQQCQKLLAVPSAEEGVLTVLYLRAGGHWYRFYLDECVLFLDLCGEPDKEEDLEKGQAYVDVARQLDVVDQSIESMVMCECTLRLTFASGSPLVLRERQDGQTEWVRGTR